MKRSILPLSMVLALFGLVPGTPRADEMPSKALMACTTTCGTTFGACVGTCPISRELDGKLDEEWAMTKWKNDPCVKGCESSMKACVDRCIP
jgi:hypothetical protein